EDVASWLHALGCWEPQARRRHDTLLRVYLDARRVRRALDTGLRVEYWLASACNGLSGAIRYHIALAADPASTDKQRRDAARALRSWQRVIRRAADVLSVTGCH